MSNLNTKTDSELSRKYYYLGKKGKTLMIGAADVEGIGIGIADFVSQGIVFVLADDEGAWPVSDLVPNLKDVREDPRQIEDFSEFRRIGTTGEGTPYLFDGAVELLESLGMSEDGVEEVEAILEDIKVYFGLSQLSM